MAQFVIRPIPLMSLSRLMPEQVYRVAGFVGQIAVAGIYIWYIEGPKTKIVVDAGLTADIMRKAGLVNLTHIQSLEQGLAKFGLKPKDIDLVIMTHLHIDHVALATAFTKARFLVQQAELDYQRNPPPAPVDPRPCAKELLDTLKWEVVKGDYQIESGLKVLFTPGHTPGGQSIAVETAKGQAIIDGLCTSDFNWNVPEAMKARFEVLIPDIHNDPMQAYNSLIKIKKMADIKVPIHEGRFASIDKIPE